MPTANDFFCGAGGMGLGLKAAGFDIVGAFDFDKYAVQTYKHNVGDYVKQADIRKMVASDLPTTDLWAFGFPCQDVSLASGNPKGLQGARSGLFYEVMRLLDEMGHRRPRIILAENVVGIAHHFDEIEKQFQLRGYSFTPILVNSKDFGVPQDRKRYLLLGVLDESKEIFLETVPTPPLKNILDQEAPFLPDLEWTRKVIEEAAQRTEIYGVHACLTPHRVKRQNGRRAKEHNEPAHTLTTMDKHGVILCDRIRHYTPHELAKLQGFTNFNQVVSDEKVLKQMGNAVTVNVAKAVGQAIIEQLF